MSEPTRPTAKTAELLSRTVALITAAQSMLDGRFGAQDFADEVNEISTGLHDAADALSHMAIACAQVLRAAADGSGTALTDLGLRLAAYVPPPDDPPG